jgi:predicted transcriptional regulator
MTAYHQTKNPSHGNRKYGEEDVKRWREIMRTEKLSQKALAEKLGLSYSTVQKTLEEF